jgi:hypothetical protein
MIKEVCDIWGHNRGSACTGNHVSVPHKRTAKQQSGRNSVSWKSVQKLPISATNCHVGGHSMPAKIQYSIHFSRIWILFNYCIFIFYTDFVRCFLKYFPPCRNSPWWTRASSLQSLHDHTQTHTHTHTHSVGLRWTSDQSDAETSTGQHRTLTTDSNIHAPGGIWTRNPGSKRPQTERPLGSAFLIYTLRQILLEWLNHGGWDGRGT